MKRPNRQAGKKTPTYEEKKNITREKKSGEKKEENIGAEKAEGQEALARLNRRGGCVRDTNCTFRDRTGGRGAVLRMHMRCAAYAVEKTRKRLNGQAGKETPHGSCLSRKKKTGKKKRTSEQKRRGNKRR